MKVVGLAFVLAACWSTARPAPPRPTPHIELHAESAELANGLRFVVVAEPTAGEVAITMRYGTGAVDDPPGREGLAHLAEHVLFEPVIDRLETEALAFNGFTTDGSTLYVEHAVPSRLGAMLEIEAARLRSACSDISEAAFERQREVVRNELRERADDTAIQSALATGVFGAGHPFARVSTVATVAAITRDDVCAFVAQHYAPQNAVLVVSGQTTLAEVRPLVEAGFGEVPRGEARATKSAGAPAQHQASLEAPLEREWVLLAWPLPSDPVLRAKVRAVANMAVTLIRVHLSGVATTLELGDGDTQQLAIAIAPRTISSDDALASARHALTHTDSWFGSGLYEYVDNRAIYQYVARLDHAGGRDIELADEVAAGRAIDVLAPLDQLRAMTRADAHALIESALDPDKATIVRLHPGTAKASGGGLVSTFHEQRPRRPEDPQAATRPLALEPTVDPLAGVRRYTLANGLNVVFAPLGTVPIIDVRLVLPAGTADDPHGQRGVAELAANALDANFDSDALRFIQAGGSVDADAAFDHTAFVARGVAGQLDTLLQGLVGIVREGNYDDVGETVRWLNASISRDRSARIADDAWRTAIYGAAHPYARAGQWAHADRLSTDDLGRFHAAHYRPLGATLIVAGKFDPADAERWVAYYFADWRGTGTPRTAERAHLAPLAFTQVRAGAQLTIQIAFTAPEDPAIACVVAEMLDEASADVRDELAASYGVHAALLEHRLGSTIVLAGDVDADRAGEVAKLLRERLARLPSDPALFVSARRRVVANLRSIDTSAAGLAERFVRDTELVRPTAEATAALTFDRIAPALALHLTDAAILLRGPAPATSAAASGFGRTATPLD